MLIDKIISQRAYDFPLIILFPFLCTKLNIHDIKRVEVFYIYGDVKMCKLIKVATGEESKKIVLGKKEAVKPFCGINVKNKCSIAGFEYINGHNDVYYLSENLDLVTSWRTMKILEAVEHIDENTIEYCWKLAGLTSPSDWNSFISRDGSNNFFGFIREIFTAFPEEKTLESMRLALRLTNR